MCETFLNGVAPRTETRRFHVVILKLLSAGLFISKQFEQQGLGTNWGWKMSYFSFKLSKFKINTFSMCLIHSDCLKVLFNKYAKLTVHNGPNSGGWYNNSPVICLMSSNQITVTCYIYYFKIQQKLLSTLEQEKLTRNRSLTYWF